MDKKLHPSLLFPSLPFPYKDALGITKNYSYFYLHGFEIASNLKLRKNFGKIRMVFRETDPQHSNDSSNHGISCKKSRGYTIVCRFLHGIWFHTQGKYGANTSSLWSPQRNYHSQNDTQSKYENQSTLTGWRHGLRHCCWSSARRYISSISVNNLPRLRTSNVDRSYKGKWLYTKKKEPKSRRYPAKSITDTNDIALLANTPAQAECLLHSLELVAGYIGLYMNANKTEYMF